MKLRLTDVLKPLKEKSQAQYQRIQEWSGLAMFLCFCMNFLAVFVNYVFQWLGYEIILLTVAYEVKIFGKIFMFPSATSQVKVMAAPL